MIKCKEAIDECRNTGMCCVFCEFNKTCEDACEHIDKLDQKMEIGKDCVSSFEDTEENNLSIFQTQALEIMQGIVQHKKDLDRLKEEDEDLRTKLTEVMQKYGIKSFDNDLLKITSIAEGTKTTVDSKKLKEEAPDIFKKYSKTSTVKAYVKIEVK